VDERFEMTGLYAERLLPSDAMERYYERHYQQPLTGFPRAFAARASAPDPVSVHRFTKLEQESDYFRAVLSRLDAYQILYGVLRDHSRPIGQISIYRGEHDPEFGRRDQDALRGLLRYLSVGLRPAMPSHEASAPAEVVEEWLGIVGVDGTPASAPADWSRLVRLLAIQEVTPRGAHDEQRTVVKFLQRICARLIAADGSRLGLIDSQHDSPWGRFRIRAYRMPDMRGDRPDLVGVLIGRTEPRALALVRGTGASGLSPQQREVALLLADGKSNQDIARALSLKLNTASYHVKQVFARLGVHNRKEVERELLKLAHEGTLDRVGSDEREDAEEPV
jgi:DNA-binding CsgD family transcriptional regulator